MEFTIGWREFAQQMASMARDLLAQSSVEETLTRITLSATELVQGCDAAGILALQGGQVQTLAPTDQLVIDSDEQQASLGEGPCFDAARIKEGERVFRIADFTADEDLGALNLYSHEPGAFTDDSETAGWLLASHAAVAFSSARTHAQMEQAVSTRHTIGEAMGILMGGHHLTEQQAFDVLRHYSQENNIKLREVARQVCEQGSL